MAIRFSEEIVRRLSIGSPTLVNNIPNQNYLLYVGGASKIEGPTDIYGKLYINNAEDAEGTNDLGTLIIGDKTAYNIAIDNNEIMARNNKKTSVLSLNTNGGEVQVGSGGIKTSGDISAVTFSGSGASLTNLTPTNITGVVTTTTKKFLKDTGVWAQVDWADLTGKPTSFNPATHNHSQIVTVADNRSIATTPNDYKNALIFQGLKSNGSIENPSTNTYSYVVGLRGWSDSSGGDSHELAFNNNGINWRHGATDTWSEWKTIAYTDSTVARATADASGNTITSTYAPLTSPALTGTPTAPTAANGTSTAQIATTEFVNNTLAYVNAMTFKGTLGTGGTITALPASHKAGDTYRVITADTYAGKYCEIGTLIICVKDGTVAADTDWTSVETNEDGAVIGPSSSTNNAIVRFDGATGRIIQDSKITIDDNGNLLISHAASATMTADSTNPKITFAENGSQPVHLIYSDYDNYRSPAGLKIIGGTSATPAWLEVEGNVYAAAFKGNADSATSAKYINLYEARGTTTTLNKAANYVTAGAMFHLVASSSTNATDNGKTPTDANILQMNWDNNGGYDSQLGIATSINRMYFRSRPSAKAAWDEVAHAPVGTAGVGNSTQPVYMTSEGVITACTAYANASVNYATSAGSASTATKVEVANAAPTSYTQYYLTYTTSTTTGYQNLNNSPRLYWYDNSGSEKTSYLCIGSSNHNGGLTVRNANGKYANIITQEFDADRTLTLPNETGTFALLTKADINTLINSLDSDTTVLTGNDYMITQSVGGGTTTKTYYRRMAKYVRVGGLITARKLWGNDFDGTADVDGTISLGDEKRINTYITRKKEGGNGWAFTPLVIRDNTNSDFAHIGVFGSANTLAYIYIGSNDYDGNNLRITPDGKVRIPVTTAASSKTTGALVVGGGAGFEGTVYANGFNGPLTGNADTATRLATAREIYVDLSSTRNISSKVTFDGSLDKAIHVSGTLPIAQGGTGKTSAADAWTALGGGASGKHADSYFALASHGTHVTATTVKSALGTVTETAGKFLKDTGSWAKVAWGDLDGKPSTFTPSSHSHTGLVHRLSSVTKGSNPASIAYGLGSWAYEAGTGTAIENRLFGLEGNVNTSGRSFMQLIAYENTANSTTTNRLGCWIDKNGTMGYTVSSPEKFRAAIEAAAASHDHDDKYVNITGDTMVGTGTATTEQWVTLAMGNNKAVNTAGNYSGQIRIYDNLGHYQQLRSARSALTDDRTVYLPAKDATCYLVDTTGTGASGTWGINITGNAETATSAAIVNSYNADFDAKQSNNGGTTRYKPTFTIYDTNSLLVGYCQSQISSNGNISTILAARNWDTTGTTKETNALSITIAKDGTCTYSVSSPSNFRTAIGAAASNHTHSDYCTLSTAQTFTGNKTFNSICYFANGTTYYVNDTGNAVFNAVTVKATTASTSTSTGALIVKGGIGAAGNIYGTKVYNAVWNDYAECREIETEEPGYCVTETSNGCMIKTTKRLQPGCKLISDTFGTCMGKTDKAKTPIAVAGRVLAYPYRNRSEYCLGAAVCSAPNGTVDIMTREEIMTYPERIVGTVSEIPTYEVWHGGNQDGENDIFVNGRIWIYVR